MLSVDFAYGVHSRHIRHLQVHEHHIGFQFLVGLHGLPAVAGLTDHLVVVVSGQEHAVGLANHGIIIGDEHATEFGHGETIIQTGGICLIIRRATRNEASSWHREDGKSSTLN